MQGVIKVNRTIKILVTVLTTCMLMVSGAFGTAADAAKKPVVAEGLQGISVKGSTDLPGHFFLSFVFDGFFSSQLNKTIEKYYNYSKSEIKEEFKLSGQEYFTVTEMEVYQVIFSN